jgi:hypothetical protein
MRRHPRTPLSSRRLLRCLLALGIVLIPFETNPLLAQSNESDYDVNTSGILVEAAAGWDGTVDQSRPVPVSFLFSNASQQNVDAGLYLSDPVRRHEIKIGDVFLGAGSTRQFSSVVNLDDWYECVASLRDERGVVWSRLLPTATGREFDSSANFLLFISDSGRALTLPTDKPAEGTATAAIQRDDVRCLTVKSWQVPRHYGPLVAAQAMVFPDASTMAGELNRVQWRAITDWVCQGGRLFVHADSAEILERLSEASAISPGLPEMDGIFEARPMGLGKLLLYDQPLFAGDASTVRNSIGDVTAKLSRDHISFLVDPGDIRVESSGHAELNRVVVVIFFLCYTLASGVVTLLLFRSTRRRVVIYITSVVGVSTVLAASLGAFLRVSDGDLRWITATQVGAGGTVQMARIEVQSSGGRSKTVSVTGDRPDLQYLGPRDNNNFYYYYWDRRQSGFPPFTWQPSQVTNDDRAYQVNAPVTPWGFSRLHASATGSWGDAADIMLDFKPTPRSQCFVTLTIWGGPGKRGQVPKTGTARRVLCIFGT